MAGASRFPSEESGYSVLTTLGYSSSWLARQLFRTGRIGIDPLEQRKVNIGSVVADMGAYRLRGTGILVVPATAGYREEGGVDRWSRGYAEDARRIVGLGWCGSQEEHTLGKIVVPKSAGLSPKARAEQKPVGGNGRANRALRAALVEAIEERNGNVAEGRACTYFDPEDAIVPRMSYGDMETGLLLRYGNHNGVPTACIWVVSDDRTERLQRSKGKVAPSFLKRIRSYPFKRSYEIGLWAARDVLKQADSEGA